MLKTCITNVNKLLFVIYGQVLFAKHGHTNSVSVLDRLIEPNEIRLKDPRTGFDYASTYAIQHLFITRPSCANLVLFIKNSIPEIIAEQINAFVSDEDN